MRKMLPPRLPRMVKAPRMEMPRKSMAQVPRAEASSWPLPRVLSSE